MDSGTKLRLSVGVAQIFTPSAPIDRTTLFAGRLQQVREVINAIAQRGQHVILYGERGVGKTSLANVLSDFFKEVGLEDMQSVSVNCDGTDSFSSLWRKILREMSFVSRTARIGFGPETVDATTRLDAFLPEGEVAPDDVRHILQRLSKITIIVDEVDRLGNRQASTLLADTVKTLSDHSVDTTLILVGVADSVDDLIAEHQSIERALVQIRMPRMSREELYEIVERGLKQVNMTIDQDAKEQIAELSQGLPHFTHLLAYHAASHAIDHERENINALDLDEAVRAAVGKTQQTIISAYHRATSSPRDNVYPQVLLACAMADKDQLGYFSATDVRVPMSKLMGRPYDIPAFSQHLNSFCEEKRGPVLQKTGYSRRFRYRFINPLMEPYVLMNGLANDLIDVEALNSSS